MVDETPEEVVIPEEKETDLSIKSDSKNILILVGIIVGIFLVSFGGFKLYDHFTGSVVINVDDLHSNNLAGNLDNQEGYIYNGFSFIQADGLWWTELMARETLLKVPLHFGPRDVEHIPVTGSLDAKFNQGPNVYMAINPDVTNKYYTLALSEINFNTAKGINRIPIGACTMENWACENRTIVNCENTQDLPVIELVLEDDNPRIELDGTCIKIIGSGTDYGIVKSAERLLYRWYKVMD